MFNNWEYLSKTYEELEALVRPDSATEPESFPAVLFDTQTYAQAGSARLNYFQSTAASLADPTLSNFADGKLEPDSFFELHRIYSYIMALPSVGVGTVVGGQNDIELLHKTARGNLIIELSQKRLTSIPLTFLGLAGGGDIPGLVGTLTAPAHLQFPQQARNGGFPVNGAVVIPAQTQIRAWLEFNSTAIAVAVPIRVELAGVYHRPVR